MGMGKMILSFGETLWDLLPDGRTLGGAPLNLAHRVTGLGDRGIIVSRLGRDDLGREASQRVDAMGMETTFIQWDDCYPTGTVHVTFGPDNAPDYVIVPDVAYDHIEPVAELLEAAGRADCICFGTLAQRAPVAGQTLGCLLAASPDSLKLLDVNLRKKCFSRETVRRSLQEADILRCNEDETRALAEMLGMRDHDIVAFCDQMIARWTLSHCLVTLGERGTYAASATGERAYVPGYRVAVVDTLGAGDAFTAGFLHRFLRGAPLTDCLELGNALGAMVASQQGATEPIHRADVTGFLAADRVRISDKRLEPFART
jgi:fructokinase